MKRRSAAFKRIRKALGVTQREFAELLGISLRAVQSYEQQWRKAPPCVEKLARLALFLKLRAEGDADGRPCWELTGCSEEARSRCLACIYDAGELCWLVTGNLHRGRKLDKADAKLAACEKCPVMADWISDDP